MTTELKAAATQIQLYETERAVQDHTGATFRSVQDALTHLYVRAYLASVSPAECEKCHEANEAVRRALFPSRAGVYATRESKDTD